LPIGNRRPGAHGTVRTCCTTNKKRETETHAENKSERIELLREPQAELTLRWNRAKTLQQHPRRLANLANPLIQWDLPAQQRSGHALKIGAGVYESSFTVRDGKM